WLKSRLLNPTPNKNRDTFQVSINQQSTRNYALISGGEVDYPENDILYWLGPFDGCAAACDSTPGCRAYTLHKDNGTNCWLKSRLLNPTPNKNRDTFQVSINQQSTRNYALISGGEVDYPENDILYWQGPFDGCAAACDSTPECMAYTLHKDNGTNCWLKSRL